jgi:hypothetical protein
MARDTYGQSFFGEVTNRLARLLQLEGRVPVKLQEGVTPVVVVGDGTIPGMASYSGKRWMAGLTFASTVHGIAASATGPGIIVEQIVLRTSNLGTNVSFWWASPAVVAGWAAGLVAPTPAQVLDSPSVDIPPLSIFQGVAAGAAVQVAALLNYPATAADLRLDFPFYLAPGCGFRVASSAASNLSGFIAGRIF